MKTRYFIFNVHEMMHKLQIIQIKLDQDSYTADIWSTVEHLLLTENPNNH